MGKTKIEKVVEEELERAIRNHARKAIQEHISVYGENVVSIVEAKIKDVFGASGSTVQPRTRDSVPIISVEMRDSEVCDKCGNVSPFIFEEWIYDEIKKETGKECNLPGNWKNQIPLPNDVLIKIAKYEENEAEESLAHILKFGKKRTAGEDTANPARNPTDRYIYRPNNDDAKECLRLYGADNANGENRARNENNANCKDSTRTNDYYRVDCLNAENDLKLAQNHELNSGYDPEEDSCITGEEACITRKEIVEKTKERQKRVMNSTAGKNMKFVSASRTKLRANGVIKDTEGPDPVITPTELDSEILNNASYDTWTPEDMENYYKKVAGEVIPDDAPRNANAPQVAPRNADNVNAPQVAPLPAHTLSVRILGKIEEDVFLMGDFRNSENGCVGSFRTTRNSCSCGDFSNQTKKIGPGPSTCRHLAYLWTNGKFD